MWSCKRLAALTTALFVLPTCVRADDLVSLSDVWVIPPSVQGHLKNAAEFLASEASKRSRGGNWHVVNPGGSTLGEPNLIRLSIAPSSHPIHTRAEAFEIQVSETYSRTGTHVVTITGADDRGVLFGCGRLLRELKYKDGATLIQKDLHIVSSPSLPLRGHQLGYRPKTNSYDAWTPEIWERYIRDLIVFGVNAIELIPPRSDDAPTSPHFVMPQIEMMKKMSAIADKYGIDVWIWYPAMDKDYSSPATVNAALKEWGDVFRQLPRIDVVFVPGGDPGHTEPKYLMALLEKETKVLHESHPRAQMWMSPQSFDQAWMDEFYGIMKDEQPKWLSGIVFGPQNRPSLHDMRAALPKQYPIRLYPDITHSIRAQYAVNDWDVAYAITEDREVINPRPRAEANILRLTKDDSIGFITYSEGCNDDVNKFAWSAIGWDPDAKVEDFVRQYARYFIGGEIADDFAKGLLALEENWGGPLLTNESVETTLALFQGMEREATMEQRRNWRFQQALFRAYYDAYTRRRLIYETELEKRAMDALAGAKKAGALKAVEMAQAELARAEALGGTRMGEPPILRSDELRTRIFALAEALYQSIRMQLSVPLYKAIDVGRGAHLDLIDRPLNNREWLENRFGEIRAIKSEKERLVAIDGIVHWTDAAPGGFYDDLGNPSAQPHLVRGLGAEKDPEFRESSRVGFAVRKGYRMSWNTFAESVYDAPLKMQYDGLDPKREYRLRVVYAGERDDRMEQKIRLMTDDGAQIHDYMEKQLPPRPLEFAIPKASTQDGALTLVWNQTPGQGHAGRSCQVAEVWLEPVK